MPGEIKTGLGCLITACLSLVVIGVIDSAGGVPFNYAVPIAFIAALFPFAVLYWRGRSLRRAATTGARGENMSHHYSRSTLNVPARRDTRVATIHSIITPRLVRSHRQS